MTTGTGSNISKAYDPAMVEERIYKFWLDNCLFNTKVDRARDPFVVIQPPPNVTGELHIGRAMPAAIEDTLTRWHRMLGDPTLWLPGKDHAGIATQVVVEKQLSDEGLSRYDVGRQEFINRVKRWVETAGSTIDGQHKRLGVSMDWSRLRYTLDSGPSRAVVTTFVNLFKKGLIYRGERIINWCCRCQTALSDLEVDHQDIQGQLYYIRYPLKEGGYVVVATTRPETMLGDTAVAVSPDDTRYQHLVGQEIVLPIAGRILRIIADSEIDPEFGTGAVKVTPAHDPIDFEIGQRNNLETINVIGYDGAFTEDAGSYGGMDVIEVRKSVIKELEKLNLIEKVVTHQHSVGHCQRCKSVIEPLVSVQWWVKSKPLAAPAIQAVESGRTKIVPERFKKIYLHWMNNIRDWCISRQLWWGHRIPVWYCVDCDGDKIHISFKGYRGDLRTAVLNGHELSEVDDRIEMSLISTDAQPIVSLSNPGSCPSCNGSNLFQDPDVLDTWFSSALWTHSTLGWSWEESDYSSKEAYEQQKDDLDYFYPSTVLETGHDILFFWVAKMMMMGLENMGREPFNVIFLHGLIRDEDGLKMSTSTGNVVDPLEVIDKYGADALRFALTHGTTPGNDLRLGEAKLEASRNFANKIWNASRFVMANVVEHSDGMSVNVTGVDELQDRWILSRLNKTVESVNDALNRFELGDAQEKIWNFIWHEYCDWYIEMAKLRLGNTEVESPGFVLTYVLDQTLRLLHPFMPFITEEIWQNLSPYVGSDNDKPKSIMVAKYPCYNGDMDDHDAEIQMDYIIAIVRSIRNARADLHIPLNERLVAMIDAGTKHDTIYKQSETIKRMAKLEEMTFVEKAEMVTAGNLTLVVEDIVINLVLEDKINLSEEKARLEEEISNNQTQVLRLQSLLNKPAFKSKAPRDVVEKEEQRLADIKDRMARLTEVVSRLHSDS